MAKFHWGGNTGTGRNIRKKVYIFNSQATWFQCLQIERHIYTFKIKVTLKILTCCIVSTYIETCVYKEGVRHIAAKETHGHINI